MRTPLIPDVIYINTEKEGIPVEVAIVYNTSYSENLHSYVNISTPLKEVLTLLVSALR